MFDPGIRVFRRNRSDTALADQLHLFPDGRVFLQNLPKHNLIFVITVNVGVIEGRYPNVKGSPHQPIDISGRAPPPASCDDPRKDRTLQMKMSLFHSHPYCIRAGNTEDARGRSCGSWTPCWRIREAWTSSATRDV